MITQPDAAELFAALVGARYSCRGFLDKPVPLTTIVIVLAGLVFPPKHWVFWLLRWDAFNLYAWAGLVLVPCGHDDGRTLVGESGGRLEPEAAVGSRDHRGAPCEIRDRFSGEGHSHRSSRRAPLRRAALRQGCTMTAGSVMVALEVTRRTPYAPAPWE